MPSFFPPDVSKLAEEVLAAARAKKLRLTLAESCTGGLIAACLTEIAGSSDVVDRGFVAYSNESKTEQVGVPLQVLLDHGSVSAESVQAMALGARRHSKAQLALAVTGIAGPGGATPAKPVGLVYIGISSPLGTRAAQNNFSGDRADVRLATLRAGLQELLAEIGRI